MHRVPSAREVADMALHETAVHHSLEKMSANNFTKARNALGKIIDLVRNADPKTLQQRREKVSILRRYRHAIRIINQLEQEQCSE